MLFTFSKVIWSSLLLISLLQNTPLYISTFDENIKLQALIHSSLDVLEERVALGCKTGPNAPADQFLGLLSISEGFKVYGAISNTKQRFLVATTDAVVREEDVKLVSWESSFAFYEYFFPFAFFFKHIWFSPFCTGTWKASLFIYRYCIQSILRPWNASRRFSKIC